MLFFTSVKQAELIMNNILPQISSIEVDPKNPTKHSVIWLHGLGADGNDFVPIVEELELSPELAVRFVFPHAPIMPITLNNGLKMRAWFDIISLGNETTVDQDGFKNAIYLIEELINREINRGIISTNIMLAGFSQGASIALATGIRYAKPLAGVIALSGFLPKVMMTRNLSFELPIFLAHGIYDQIVPYALGKQTFVDLSESGFSPDWHSYPMEHSVCAAEIKDISTFIHKIW